MASPNALIAASQILVGERIDDPRGQRRGWQDEAWGFYDDSGPLRYGTTWLANLISRARLQAAKLPPGGDEPEPIENGPAAEAVEMLAGGINGQAAMLRSCAIELTVPGVCYLVGTGGEGDQETWRIYSQDVIRLVSPATPTEDAVYEVQEGPKSWMMLPPESIVVKIWRPHERFFWEPDSPARAALPALRELRRISQYIDATLVSRLSGAGIFIFPQEASFPTANKDGKNTQHPFVTEIMNTMMTAVRQPGTAAQVVPIPVEVPGELADKFQHLTFATELSDKILAMRESALRQTSISLDIPAEILTGMGDVNHWGQWQIEESAVKVHAEPLLEIITAALTEGYLIPRLTANGEDTENVIIWADTSELTTRPDRSDDALKLNEHLAVSDTAARRESGLGDGDKPTDEEFEKMLLTRLALSGGDLARSAVEALGIDLPEAPQPEPTEPEVDTNEEPEEDESGASQETMPGTDGDEPPETASESFSISEILALEAHVLRALERAGNRIRSDYRNTHELADCPPEQAHCCVGGLTDTTKYLPVNEWARLSTVANQLGLDPVKTVARCDEYCREIIRLGFAYDRGSFICGLAGNLNLALSRHMPEPAIVIAPEGATL